MLLPYLHSIGVTVISTHESTHPQQAVKIYLDSEVDIPTSILVGNKKETTGGA
jgi:hypothetical protein